MLNSGLVKYDIKTGRVIKDFSWRDKIDLWIASLYYSPKTNSLYIGSYSGLQVVDNVSLAEPGINTFFTETWCIPSTKGRTDAYGSQPQTG